MLDSSEPGVEFISILSFVPFSNCEIIRGDQKLLGPKLELGRGSLQKCQPRGCLNYNQKMGRDMRSVVVMVEHGFFPSLRVLTGSFAVTQNRTGAASLEQCAER